jgi:prepilin peptidase CpaA
MDGGLFSYALLAALAMALGFAAFTDMRRRQIDNWLNLAIALSAPLFWFASGLDWAGVAFQIGLAFITFAVACALFATRQMGGGDVKLSTALALWFVPSSFLQLVMMMAMIGGGASIAMAFFNMDRRPGETVRVIAATIAAFAWVGFAAAACWGIATGTPLLGPATADALARFVPNGWQLMLLLLAAVMIVALGLSHILRRQKSRLPIPYGVAISAAGIWVLADRYLSTGFGGPNLG